MRKVLIEKIGDATNITAWDTEKPDKKVTKSYNQGANILIENDVLIIEDSNNVFPKQRILFSELDENYGTTDIESFGIYLNENGFFLISGGAWGDITGNLSNQTDLQTALNSKLDKVTTAGVERVYTINADGSQDTKPTSELGTQFKKKIENTRYKSILSGENVIIPFQAAGQSHYSVTSAALVSVAGFTTAGLTTPMYEGQDVIFENQTGHDITLKASFGVDTSFVIGADLVVPNKGKIWFRFRNNELELIMKSWVNVDLSTKQDKLTETNFGQFMDVDLATKLTPSVNDTFLGRDILTNEAVEFSMDYIQPKLTNPITGTGTNGQVAFFNGATIQSGDNGLFWDNTNKRLGIGTNSPNGRFSVEDWFAQTTLTGSNITIKKIDYSAYGGWVRNLLDYKEFNDTTYLQIGSYGSQNTLGYNYIGQAYDNTTIRWYLDKRVTLEGNVGIGSINTPGARLDVRAQGALSTDIAFRVRNSTDTKNFLVVNGAGDVYNNGAGGINSNTFFGENVGRNTTGGYNTAFGCNSLLSNVSGNSNTSFGIFALKNTTSNNNSAFGSSALQNNTTGIGNVGVGLGSLYNNTTGGYNTAIGYDSLVNIVDSIYTIGIGMRAGQTTSDGITALTKAEFSIFIGNNTRANANNETNQIVIGSNAIGLGSNSVVLGNSSITRTRLQGQVIMGSFASAPTGIEGAIYYDSTTKKHRGFNGTAWNDLY